MHPGIELDDWLTKTKLGVGNGETEEDGRDGGGHEGERWLRLDGEGEDSRLEQQYCDEYHSVCDFANLMESSCDGCTCAVERTEGLPQSNE